MKFSYFQPFKEDNETMQQGNYENIQAVFQEKFGRQARLMIRACGRINLIGEHTDYNDGYVLPAAIDKHLYFAIAENGTSTCHFWAEDIKESGEADLKNLSKGKQLWLNYLCGILQQFQLDGKDVCGVDVAFGGDLPIGAGVSSSAALECGFGWALNQLFDAGYSKPDIARVARHSSNQFMGIPSGIMDQFASIMGKANHFILLDCRSLEHLYIPADLGDYQIVLLNSNVHHELASSAYSDRVAECRAGVAILQKYYTGIKSLRDVDLTMLESHQDEVNPIVFRRCKYVINEHNRTLKACEYLQNGQIEALGQLLFATHEGLRDDYEVSCVEIDFLVDIAKDFKGVAGARVMGGGFGGCTINLVKQDLVSDFVEKAKSAYYKKFKIELEHLKVNISDGTDVL
ncbi:MAG: galactokinase [Saprospiraceae bacterium]|nr:galactokinase [Saprospiraceae bacterium]